MKTWNRYQVSVVLNLYLCHANVIETTQEKYMKSSMLLVLTTNTTKNFYSREVKYQNLLCGY